MSITKQCSRQRGSILLSSLMVLLILTLLGILAVDTTTIELMVATNDRTYREAFNAADGGSMAAIKVLKNSMDEDSGLTTHTVGAVEMLGMVSYVESANDFYLEAIDIDPVNPSAQDPDADLTMVIDGDKQVNVDVQRLRTVPLFGGGAEFGNNGTGTRVGAAAVFGIESQATGRNNSTSTIYLEYYKALGVPGGL